MSNAHAPLPGSGGPDAEQPVPVVQHHVLLVDDEPNVLSALRRIFRRERYRITTATNGPRALEILAQNPTHLMIVDHQMPGMTGVELLQRAREISPDTIRVMLTGHADTSAIASAVEDGAIYRFIQKPAEEEDLLRTAAQAIQQYDIVQKNRDLQSINQLQSKELAALSRLTLATHSQLPHLLHLRSLIDQGQVQRLERMRAQRKVSVVKLLLELEWVSQDVIRKVLREDLNVEEVILHEVQVDPAVTELIPRALCARQLVIPLMMEGRKQLLMAMADPTDRDLMNDLRFVTGMHVEPVLADVAAIESKIVAVYGDEDPSIPVHDVDSVVAGPDPFDSIEIMIEEEDEVPPMDILRTKEEPAIRLLNAILSEAIQQGASDIHIQPMGGSALVRYRVDGVLVDKFRVPLDLHRALISRIKVMAELDIAERRRPQDGRITVRGPLKVVDVRISTIPTVNGEKAVLRILDRNGAIHSITDLAFSETNLSKLLNIVDRPQGIILATGPTGSGKTTTLYSLIQHNVTQDKNYITLEDPVEYYMDVATQVAVRERIGMDFATALRAVLRQDPDVILLGEIRDEETAQVAFNAAMTGHQVYSTLHTNSAIETLSRLHDLGLRPHIIATALTGIISQRLVRRICPHCREEHTCERGMLARLGTAFADPGLKTWEGRGCQRCHQSGFSGRYPLHELLVVDDDVAAMISAGRTVVEIRRAMAEARMPMLIDDARAKVHDGHTTACELLRVLGPQI